MYGLRIKNITTADDGMYYCRAEVDSEGRYDERGIEVIVYSKFSCASVHQFSCVYVFSIVSTIIFVTIVLVFCSMCCVLIHMYVDYFIVFC